MLKTLTLTFLLLMIMPGWAEGRQYYRYQDDSGQTVIANSIPPEFVKKGYEVLDENGAVVRVVEPQLSDEERLRRQQEEERAKASKERERELIKLYRTPRDVDRAMRTALNRLEARIQVKKNRIAVLRNEYNELQSRAADQERAGQTVSAEILDKMKDIDSAIDGYRAEISDIEQIKAETRKRFGIDREDMIDIYQRRTGKLWVEPDETEDTKSTEDTEGTEGTAD